VRFVEGGKKLLPLGRVRVLVAGFTTFSLPGPSTLWTSPGLLPRNASTRAETAWSALAKV
jgi:hypothetical protein